MAKRDAISALEQMSGKHIPPIRKAPPVRAPIAKIHPKKRKSPIRRRIIGCVVVPIICFGIAMALSIAWVASVSATNGSFNSEWASYAANRGYEGYYPMLHFVMKVSWWIFGISFLMSVVIGIWTAITGK